jgi:hypothetical protein
MNGDNVFDEINKEKTICEKDILTLIERAKTYHVNNIDISKYYDLNNDYDKYKIDDSVQRYNLNKDIIDYKLHLLETSIHDLEEEKKFLDYKLKKEQELNNKEYNEYLTNVVARTEYVDRWYNEY